MMESLCSACMYLKMAADWAKQQSSALLKMWEMAVVAAQARPGCAVVLIV